MENNKLIIEGVVIINGVEIHNIFGEFGDNQKCLLAKEIANVHGIEVKEFNRTIQRHISRFRENIDIIDLKGTESEVEFLHHEIFTQNSLNRSNNIYLFSRKGYLKLVGIMEDDLAYDIQDQMIDEYFELKELEITKEDKLCLSIIKANSQEGRMVAVGELVEYKNQQIAEKDKLLQIQSPKVAMADRFAVTDSLLGVRKVAKIFNERIKNNKTIGEKKLFEILRIENILQDSDGEWNIPYQRYIDAGYFELKPSTHSNGFGSIITDFTTKVTGKGLEWLWKQLLKKGYVMSDDVKLLR